jgi:hypothetical protein
LLKQDQLKEKYFQALRDCLSMIPSSVIISKPLNNQKWADAIVLFKNNGHEKEIFIELTTLGTPKRIRNAVNQLRIILNDTPDAYGIVIAPYISNRSAQICKEANLGYVDLSGNFWISFDSIFLSQENMPNKYPVETSLSNLYAPKSERVLRVLLTNPYKVWKTKALAEEADISLGMITHIRRRLEEEEWVEKHDVGFNLSNPTALLEDWVENYDFGKHERHDYYTMSPLIEAESRLCKICEEANINSALTGFAAANRLAPMVKGQKSIIFVSGDIVEIGKDVNFKPVNTGANISLIKPYDQGVFWNRAQIKDVQIATPIQIYLDLKQMRGRGEEAAEFLFTEVIQQRWLNQKLNMNRD